MNQPAFVSLTFDDGLRCQLERAVPILDRHGFPGTFFLVANTDPIHTDGLQHPDWHKLTWSNQDIGLLKKMSSRGHEIGAHSVSHRWDEILADPKGEAEISKRWIQDRVMVEIVSYGYPFYRVNDPIKQAVIGAGYRQARSGTNAPYYSTQSTMDFYSIDCRQIAANEGVAGWVKPGYWHVLTFHGIGTLDDGWEPIAESEFARQMDELAKYRDSGQAEVVTFKDGADHLREPH